MLRRLSLAALALLTLGASPALAQNVPGNGDYNWNETTGLVNIPVARTVPAGSAFLSLGLADIGRYPASGTRVGTFGGTLLDSDSFFSSDGSLHAVGSPLPGWELSVMTLHAGNVKPVFGTKVLLNREGDWPAFAIGAHNLFSYDDNPSNPSNPEPDSFRRISPFVVASKQVGLGSPVMDLHAGIGSGRFQGRVFYGGELRFDNGLGLLGEFDGTVTSYGVRYTGLDDWRFTAAIQDGWPAVQIGYQFGDSGLYGGPAQP